METIKPLYEYETSIEQLNVLKDLVHDIAKALKTADHFMLNKRHNDLLTLCSQSNSVYTSKDL